MRKVCSCAKGDFCVVDSSKSYLVMPTVHMYNFESISVTEEIKHLQNNDNHLHV